MMLATNKEIRSKEDVVKVVRIYFSRWRIEEYLSHSPVPAGLIKVPLFRKLPFPILKKSED